MCYWVLAKNAQQLVRSTAVPIPEDELRDPTLIKCLAQFNTDIEIKLGKFDPGTAIGDSPEETIANTFTNLKCSSIRLQWVVYFFIFILCEGICDGPFR